MAKVSGFFNPFGNSDGGGGSSGEGYSKAEVDRKINRLEIQTTQALETKADSEDVYEKTEIDENFYTKEQVNEMLESADGSLSQPLTANETIGSVTPGKTYPKGTPFEQILRDILIKYLKPTISLSLSPSKTLYDAVTENISEIQLVAAVGRKSKDITAVKFFVNGSLVNTVQQTVTTGGTFAYGYIPSTPINFNTTFSATATDGQETVTSSVNVVFIGKSYYGIVGSDISQPTAAQVKALNNTLKNSKSYSYQHINMDYGKVVYAYPKSLGALSSIKDPVNNINYSDTFARTELWIDNIEYYVYTQIDPSAAQDVQINFS